MLGGTVPKTDAMTKSHTKCPECRTVFTVTGKQLAQRKGLVRCGRCDAVFQADQNLVAQPLAKDQTRQPSSTTQLASHSSTRAEAVTQDDNDSNKPPLPTVSELIHGRRLGPRTRPVFWGMGVFVMAALLAGQWMYFYRNQLARDNQWAAYVQVFCRTLHCTITPRHDVGLVELTDTRVTPHPKFDKSLRVKATLINRAKFTQPYPLMEVTLTDTEGKVLARKRFNAHEYLKNQEQLDAGLAPNVARKAQMEITSPDAAADGYEIRLLPSV